MEDPRTDLVSLTGLRSYPPWSQNYVIISIVTIVATAAYLCVLLMSGGKFVTVLLVPLFSILLLFVTSFELCLTILVASLFLDFHLGRFSSAIWFSIPLGVSFILTHWDIHWRELKNPLTIPIIFYGVCILPSLLNAEKPLVSLVMLCNVVAFVVVLAVIYAGINNYRELRRLVAVFLAFVFINSIHVLVQWFTSGLRSFGFSGIMFVDYAGIGICVSLAISLVSTGKRRILFVLLSCMMSLALILTQTRSAWLSVIISLVILGGYLVRRPNVSGLSRKRLITAMIVGSVLIVVIALSVFSFVPEVGNRASELIDSPGVGIGRSGLVENSLGSRILIWDAALNAFYAHPYFGIGVYSFPYSSHHYSKIPLVMYKFFVEGNSPHQTFLAVLAETGAIGSIGFLGFLFVVVRYTFQSVSLGVDERGNKYAFVSISAIVYCLVSMIFTDAWLWGQGIVLLGIVLGIMLTLRKIAMQSTAAMTK